MSGHRRQSRIPVRRLAVSVAAGLAIGGAALVAVELSDGPDTQTVEVTPARSAVDPAVSPSQEPYRPVAACRCPVRVWDDGVEVPPPAPRPQLQVCALGSTACLTQPAADVIGDGPVTR